MKLCWIKLVVRNKAAYGLFLVLGTASSKCYICRTEGMPTTDITVLRNNAAKLAELSLGDRIIWLKKALPDTYKERLRVLNKSQVSILREYPLSRA